MRAVLKQTGRSRRRRGDGATDHKCFSFFSAFTLPNTCPAPLVMGVQSPSILTGFDGTANQVVGEGSSGVEAESGRVSRW